MDTYHPYHPVVSTIITLLKGGGYWFETWEHEPVTTSEEAAKVRHGYSLSQGAKAIIVKSEKPHQDTNSHFVMLVLPGDAKIDSKKVKKSLGLGKFSFASSVDLAHVTNGVESGGVPPWGSLFSLTVYVDGTLSQHEKIIFNAGDRRFSIAMKYRDYMTLVQPLIADIRVS
ncbi:MAG: YbaK/EbsC family protein [Candidatus Roizmanbacteria bacterium]